MPKSKNRRKPKGNKPSGAAQTAGGAEVIEGAAASSSSSSRSERVDSAPAKPKSVSPVQFAQQVRAEMQKVTWTSRGETMVSTIMVLVMVAIMSLFFFTVDQILRFVMPNLLSLNLF
ncbi:MAG: preprotein translocase subunit SecE [Pseudomonadota bacterium]